MAEGMGSMIVRVGNRVNKRMRDETERALDIVKKYDPAATNIDGNNFEIRPSDWFIISNYIKVFADTCGLETRK